MVPLAKNILASLGATAAASAIDAGNQKEIHYSACPSSSALRVKTNNFKWRNEWHNENCSSSWGF